ncbi:MAG TPA: hypothetical protein VFF37_14485 [Streptomyces sp.]|nr:hypothetical protein [Streptomyces sp.]
MASWILVPCLVSLRDEFNRLAPDRDKASDGSIGDTSHGASSSDHNPDETGNTPSEDADDRNEVHAIDTDEDLRRAGWTMNRAVQIIVTRHRAGADDRLQNVIYNRRIWSRSWGWTARAYTGSNAHTEHAHFSARYTTAQENDTRPWGLLAAQAADEEEADVPLGTDKIKLTPGAAAAIDPTGKTYKPGQEVDGTTVLCLLLIHASRANTGADEAEKAVAAATKALMDGQLALTDRVKAVEAWFTRLGDPGSVEQKVALLHAILGPQSRAAGLALADFED